ncbi:MAG: ribosome small subunit-dependent GTPase A [Gemmatimonadetes bacterium RIFCSPLOWO2_12_FULL_68_9]|nr:MAG: ribosome small subunit-dependent GTPase A [Gemmatimonadetes bacterium RIFCSPLOWO2_12_FULL_68_9]
MVIRGEGVVLSRAGGRYSVFSGGDVVTASLRGRLKHEDYDRILVGDRVKLDVHQDGSVTIEGVEHRKSLLRRRSPGKRRGVRAVAANVDQVVVVGSVREPQWDPYLMDRFVAVSEASQLPVLLVINKCDLAAEYRDVAAPYPAAGYDVLATSVRTGQGLELLRGRLLGRASIFTGPTGVGKSSLMNALQPGLKLKTQAVSSKSGSGRHTTVTAEMHRFEPEGFVIDTPGLRDIGLWGLEPLDVVHAFPDIAARASACRFDNCRHLGEPECAVEAACRQGELVASRLESFRRLLQETVEAGRPWA